MAFNQSAKEEIRRASDIVELVGQFVQLRKAGRNYVGLCPFHAERDPSFTVNPERQTFHCFGCKKGGDIFAFWMEYHSTTFPEALRDHAEKERAAKKKILLDINEKAAVYFQKALSHSPQGGVGRDYLNGRFISNDIITEFRLGYAPDEWDGLVRVLTNHNVDLDTAVEAGVIIPKKNGGYYDRFRGRIIFPIFDLRQQVVGFGGRVLDNSLPKYVNTPETIIFHKGEFLYGLNSSYKTIREKGRAVIVEGYMDWLALRKHGLHEVVATLGTALTANHVRKLKGYTKQAVVVFDSDKAGKTAVLKSLPVFSNEGLSASAVVLPEDQDPDSFLNTNGSGMFLKLLDRASPIFDFYLEQKLAHLDTDMEGKVRVLEEIFPVLSELRMSTQRSLYVRRLSERIGIKEEALWSELSRFMKKPHRKAFENRLGDRLIPSGGGKRFDDLHLLNLMIHYPHTLSRLMNCEWQGLLYDSAVIEIVNAIFKKYRQEGTFSPEELSDDLESDAARKQLREVLFEDSHYSEHEVEQAVTEIQSKAHKISISVSFRKAKGDVQAQNQLLELKRLKDQQGLNNKF
jgi:DNA primase